MLNRPELLPIVVSEAVAEQFLPVIRRQFTHAQRANHLACRKWKEAFCFLLDTLRLFPGPQIVWVAVIAIEPAHAPAPEQMRHRFVAVNRGGEFSRFWLHDLRALREAATMRFTSEALSRGRPYRSTWFSCFIFLR